MKINQKSAQAKILKEIPENKTCTPGFTCPECHSRNINYVLVEDADNYEKCTDCGHCWHPRQKDPEPEEIWEWNELKPWLREVDS